MSLTLYLIRHAKSDWGDPSLPDHDRSLNDRGRRSAAALGVWIAERKTPPLEVLCSTARRTQETWDLMAPALPAAQITLTKALYHASAGTMLDVLRTAQQPVVALFGHNPGIGELAEVLAKEAPEDPRFLRYPTGATAVFEFADSDWATVGPRRGAIVDFVLPRDLLSDRESG